MTLVQARVEMYWRFVRKHCLTDMEVAQADGLTSQQRRTMLETRLAASQLNRYNRLAAKQLNRYKRLETSVPDPDLDPFVRDTDSDPSIIEQKQ
jgi:multidrug resistance efflux pump